VSFDGGTPATTGAVVAVTAVSTGLTLQGLASPPAGATIVVGGPNVDFYRYRLNRRLSAEVAFDQPLA
jgi:hypothetical protein